MFTSRSSRLLVGVAVLAAAGYLVWLATQPGPAAPGPARDVVAPPEKKQEPVQPAVAPLPAQKPTDIPETDFIAYPDGTRLPPLNGVKKAPAMVFNKVVPYAKVIGKQFDKATGLEWYIHENGVRSTTRIQADGKVVGEIDKSVAPVPVANDK